MAIHFNNKIHSEFSAMAWLCFNVGKCDRESLNGIIKVEDVDGIIHCVSTDSHRMPIVRYKENCPLEIGYYKVVKKSKSDLILEKVEIENYPNWKAVLPTNDLEKIERPQGAFAFTNDTYNAHLPTDIYFLFLNRCCVNYKWLEDVGAFFATDWEVWHTKELALFHGRSIEKLKEPEHNNHGGYENEHDYFKFSILIMKIGVADYPPKENAKPAEQAENEKKNNEKEGQS